ncbi:MAG TPA: DUF4290 domain-containing protein, partial [Bacteroidia bacterium]|nr:DUF4290 domain-containing protein [Bacteroidia bacterium]
MEQENTNPSGMEYNTGLPIMAIAEYGRNVHRMIDYCLTLTDRAERTRCAKSIVRVMAILNPTLKEYSDYEHKLWDHLFIISEFKLDVDSPFPMPQPETLKSKPELIKYPQSDIRFRHYGKILEDLIQKAMAEEDPKNREIFTEQLAQLMKRHYLNWNRDSVNDALIVEQLESLSKGKLKVSENFRFLHTSEILPRNAIPQNQMHHRE